MKKTFEVQGVVCVITVTEDTKWTKPSQHPDFEGTHMGASRSYTVWTVTGRLEGIDSHKIDKGDFQDEKKVLQAVKEVEKELRDNVKAYLEEKKKKTLKDKLEDLGFS